MLSDGAEQQPLSQNETEELDSTEGAGDIEQTTFVCKQITFFYNIFPQN